MPKRNINIISTTFVHYDVTFPHCGWRGLLQSARCSPEWVINEARSTVRQTSSIKTTLVKYFISWTAEFFLPSSEARKYDEDAEREPNSTRFIKLSSNCAPINSRLDDRPPNRQWFSRIEEEGRNWISFWTSYSLSLTEPLMVLNGLSPRWVRDYRVQLNGEVYSGGFSV